MKPITVMLPVYNAELFVEKTIDCILNQSFINFDLLILDDGSTDRSSEIIQSYTDSRIKYVLCQHNYIKTLNMGLCLADSKYIAFIEHDDLMVPDRLEIQYNFMENNPDIVACGGYLQTFGDYSSTIKVPENHEDIFLNTLSCSCLYNTTGFIRKRLITDNKIRYKKGYSFFADYKFWFEIMKKGKTANIPQILTLLRAHDKQTSRKYSDKYIGAITKIKFEILEYFLSQMKKENELMELIDNEFIPALDEVGEQISFSENVFFKFMGELIRGLKKDGIIEI